MHVVICEIFKVKTERNRSQGCHKVEHIYKKNQDGTSRSLCASYREGSKIFGRKRKIEKSNFKGHFVQPKKTDSHCRP